MQRPFSTKSTAVCGHQTKLPIGGAASKVRVHLPTVRTPSIDRLLAIPFGTRMGAVTVPVKRGTASRSPTEQPVGENWGFVQRKQLGERAIIREVRDSSPSDIQCSNFLSKFVERKFG